MVSTYISIDKRYKFNSGENKGKYQIRLWVVFPSVSNGQRSRVQRPYKTGLFATEEDYALLCDDNRKTKRQDLLSIKRELQTIKARADELIKKYNKKLDI